MYTFFTAMYCKVIVIDFFVFTSVHVLSCVFIMQCDHAVRKHETTWHAFSHMTGHTPKEMRDYLRNFVAKDHHKVWIMNVGITFIAKKGLSIDEYLDNLLSPNVPIDELGLLIIVWMYHAHIAVIMYDWTWTTGFDLQPSDCKFVLAYCGGLDFYATCDRVEGMDQDYEIFLKTLPPNPPKQRKQRKPLDLSTKTKNKTNNKNRRSKKQTVRRNWRKSSRIISLPLPVTRG